MIHHYLLTRFNLALWQEDKAGKAIDRWAWLERRMRLFETYCLPSVIGQSCQNFSWILLVDEDTPAEYRERIKSYRSICPQIHLVGVKSQYAFRFADIFRQVVIADLQKQRSKVDLQREDGQEGDLCLTTYLDNDDCIARTFVERVQAEFLSFHLHTNEKWFLSFDYGLQLFTQLHHLATRIFYPNNHFLTLAESLSTIRTCYGFGSHFLLEKRGLANVHHIKDKNHPMWVEVIHEENVDNDVKMTFDTHLVNDKDLLRRDFSLSMDIGMGHRIAFACRVVGQMWRRFKNKLTNR